MSAPKHTPGIYRVEVVDDAIEFTPMDGPPASVPLALALAAPDMAEALDLLLFAYPYTHGPHCASRPGSAAYDPEKCDGCAPSKARAALKKAGVL
jgi:hypothetical protein